MLFIFHRPPFCNIANFIFLASLTSPTWLQLFYPDHSFHLYYLTSEAPICLYSIVNQNLHLNVSSYLFKVNHSPVLLYSSFLTCLSTRFFLSHLANSSSVISNIPEFTLLYFTIVFPHFQKPLINYGPLCLPCIRTLCTKPFWQY